MAYVHKAGPVWLIGWGTPTYDAETVYVPLFRSGQDPLATTTTPTSTAWSTRRRRSWTPSKRLELYHRINKLWIDDAAAMPLYQQLDLYGANAAHVLEGPRRRGDQGLRHGVKDVR